MPRMLRNFVAVMKILLMGDYSNCHRTLATGLRRLGHDVTVASNGSRWMDTARDIDLSRPSDSKLGGLRLWMRLRGRLRSRLEGYDVVSINNPVMVEQRPERCMALFDSLIKSNGAVFLTCMGSDTNFIKACIDPAGPLPVNEWMINGEPAPLYRSDPAKVDQWLNPSLTRLTDHIYSNIAGATTILYEYERVAALHLPPEKRAYISLPIDVKAMEPVYIPDMPQKVRFFLGRHQGRLVEKGTDLLEHAARAVVERHPDAAELVIVENRPYNEYLELLKSAHVVLDQIYSYTPATNALLAMAYGLTAVSGGEPEFYDFIGERDNRPVINAQPDYEALVSTLEQTVLDRRTLAARGRASREFVEKHNDVDMVAHRAVDFWTSRINTDRS